MRSGLSRAAVRSRELPKLPIAALQGTELSCAALLFLELGPSFCEQGFRQARFPRQAADEGADVAQSACLVWLVTARLAHEITSQPESRLRGRWSQRTSCLMSWRGPDRRQGIGRTLRAQHDSAGHPAVVAHASRVRRGSCSRSSIRNSFHEKPRVSATSARFRARSRGSSRLAQVVPAPGGVGHDQLGIDGRQLGSNVETSADVYTSSRR